MRCDFFFILLHLPTVVLLFYTLQADFLLCNTTSNYDVVLSQVPSHVSVLLRALGHLHHRLQDESPVLLLQIHFRILHVILELQVLNKQRHQVHFLSLILHNEQPLLLTFSQYRSLFFIIASEVLVSCVTAIQIGLSFPSCLPSSNPSIAAFIMLLPQQHEHLPYQHLD